MKEKNREIWNKTHICVCGKTSLSIMCMMRRPLRNMSMRTQLNRPFSRYLRGIMLRYLLMDKRELEKHIQWRGSSIMLEILKEVLCLVQWRRFSVLSRCSQTRTRHSWYVHPTSRSTTR